MNIQDALARSRTGGSDDECGVPVSLSFGMASLDGAGAGASARCPGHRAWRGDAERFRAVFESAPVGIAEVDLTGRFLCVNDSYCAMMGYAPEELLARTFGEITHPEDLEHCKRV